MDEVKNTDPGLVPEDPDSRQRSPTGRKKQMQRSTGERIREELSGSTGAEELSGSPAAEDMPGTPVMEKSEVTENVSTGTAYDMQKKAIRREYAKDFRAGMKEKETGKVSHPSGVTGKAAVTAGTAAAVKGAAVVSESVRQAVDGETETEDETGAADDARDAAAGTGQRFRRYLEARTEKKRPDVRKDGGQLPKVSAAAADAGKAVKDPETGIFFYSGEDGIRAAEDQMTRQERHAAQKRVIRKKYQRGGPDSFTPFLSRFRKNREAAAAGEKTGKAVAKAGSFIAEHPVFIVVGIIVCMVISVIAAGGAAVGGLVSSTAAPSSIGTTYEAPDQDLKGAESDYEALERALSEKTSDLKKNFPGYDSYQLTGADVGHDPYQLAALLTVMKGDFSRGDVKDDLEKIFEAQYSLKTKKTTGGVTKRVKVGESLGKVVTTGYCPCAICCVQYAGGPTASGAMPTPNHTIAVDARHPVVPMGTKVIMNGVEYSVEDTGAFAQNGVAFDVFYSTHQEALNHGRRTWEAYLADDNGSKEVEVTVSDGSSVTAVLSNGGIDKAAKALLTDDEYAWYQLLVETKGNREDLFKDLTYCNTAGGANYQIPGEALSDQKFAGMMQEAEKYLGRAYVWGGASPSTGFDCSGFVCWVINHSGNGWNVGRTTADGLRQMLAPVSASDAKPGDIIFFQNTYATAGASHVGIYVGNNMMIHCGDPIKFSRIDTPYWQQHFLSFGRLPS